MALVQVVHEFVLGCHSVAFDEHAVRMMNRRSITEEQVIEVLQHPDVTGLPADVNRQRFRKFFGSGVRIDVVFECDPTQVVVITVVRKG